ncbi:hypothetical protein Tco_1186420 [Tanacetum coccineum]
MGDENPIRTLGDYSKPSHEGYRNTIKLPKGNNVVPLRSDTIRLVQNGCLFHELRSEDSNQHLKDFLKLLATGLKVFQHDPYPNGRILLLVSLLNSFHQEGLQNSAITSLCSNNIKESLSLKHRLISRTYSRNSLIMATIFGSKSRCFMTMSILPQEDLAFYDNESCNDPRDFGKLVKAISLPQDVPSTSDCRLIELENQVQRLMEAHLAPKQPVQARILELKQRNQEGYYPDTLYAVSIKKIRRIRACTSQETTKTSRSIRRIQKCLYAVFKIKEKNILEYYNHGLHSKNFNTPSPGFDLFSDQEDLNKEEIAEEIGEPTMEEYMTKTRDDYGSGIARPKIDEKTQFELKGQFLKELHDNTFSGLDNEEANEHIEKEPDETLSQAWERFKELLLRCPQHYLTNMQEVILFYKGLDVPTRQILDSNGTIPSMNATNAKKAIQDMVDYSQKWHNGMSTKERSTDTSDGLAAIQAQLNNLGREIKKVNERVYAAQVGCESCGGPHYTKDRSLKEGGKTIKEAYYTQFRVPFPQGARYRAVAPGFFQMDNVNTSYQERRQTMEESITKFMAKSAKRHDENSNLIKEIRAATDIAIRNQGASIKTLEIQIGQLSKVLQKRGSGSLLGSTKTNPRDHVKSISTTVETEIPSIRPEDYEEMDFLDSATYSKSFLKERPRMGYQIEASTHTSDSGFLEETLPQKEKDPWSFTLPCYINNICFKKALADLGASVSVMPYSTFTNLGLGDLAPTKLIVELADRTIKHPKRVAENVLVGIDKFVFPVDFVVLDMPEDIKVPLILGRPFLSTAHAKIDVFKRKIALKIGNDKIVFKSKKPANNIIKRVYTLGLRERIELDLESRLMGEALFLNRSLDHIYRDYIELNDLNEPLELSRNQVEDLGPTIKDGEVIDEPIIGVTKTRNDVDNESNGIEEYPSFCDNDRKIHINGAYNLQFSCMIGFEHVNANFFPVLSINIMSKRFFNAIIRDKILFEGKNVVGAFVNVPIFVGNFYVLTDFVVMENMDAYRDEGMGDIIVGKPFCREVSEQDKLNGILHPHQKLKSFYKEVLNLGPKYLRDAKFEEWLTCGHVSIHKME